MLIGDLLRQIQESPEGGWLEKLAVNRDGKPLSTPSNLALVLENSVALKDVIVFDEFAQNVMLVTKPPWGRGENYPRPLVDTDVTFAQAWMDEAYRVVPEFKTLHRAFVAVASAHPVNPVKAWLESLTWDGVERLSGWTTRYLGAQHTIVTSAIGRGWLISAVARIYDAGCQVDHVLVLEGEQGAGKSSALRVLAGDAWFADEVADLGSKDAAMQLCGKWIVELAELESMRRSELTQVKAWLTRRVDRFRRPFDISACDVPRRCVFAATTNESAYLRDTTGNRRFWPVECGVIDRLALATDRNQLWAEAVVAYRAKESWGVLPADVQLELRNRHEERMEGDPWELPVWEYLEGIHETTIDAVLKHLGVARERQTRTDQMRVAAMLRAQHFRRIHRNDGGVRTWAYRREVPTVPTLPTCQ